MRRGLTSAFEKEKGRTPSDGYAYELVSDLNKTPLYHRLPCITSCALCVSCILFSYRQEWEAEDDKRTSSSAILMLLMRGSRSRTICL